MLREELKSIIDVANKRKPADIVIKNGKIIDVYQSKIIEGNIAIVGKYIVGIGDYEGERTIDVNGKYVSPGFIDAHMHIESTYVSPEEIGRILLLKGTTTIIADPHEIVNVCGINGLNYMLDAAKKTTLDIKYMLPSCVPCTEFETSVTPFEATDMQTYLCNDNILGLGEFMNYVGINSYNKNAIDKIIECRKFGKIIDGHAPNINASQLDGYIATGIHTDHECSTIEEMNDRISRGMYVELRQGSACRNLKYLIPGITKENERYCLLCTDDREPKTIIEEGHIDDCLRICIQNGLDPITAIKMATINTAQCYNLKEIGGIAPGRIANIVVFDNLNDFNVSKVFTNGELCVDDGKYLKNILKHDYSEVGSSVIIKDFDIDKLKLKCNSDRVIAMQTITDSILTKKIEISINRNKNGEFIFDKNSDINKIAVIERHNGSGKVGVGLIRGFNIKDGAIAQTIAHDSHNLMVVGSSDEDMAFAVNAIIQMNGGIVIVKNQKILAHLQLPIAGLMSDKSVEEVKSIFDELHLACSQELGIKEKEPIVLLSFMSLPVIPEIKITENGLFDVTKFKFVQ